MANVNIKFNGRDYSVTRGITILAAAQETQKLKQEFRQVWIPTLYYLKGINDIDESGVCIAEADGEIVNASVTRVYEGMNIETMTDKIVSLRKDALSKILSRHHKDCINCMRSETCELQNLLHEYGFRDEPTLPQEELEEIDTSSIVLVRDNNKCIRCKRCINVCAKKQAVSAIAATGTGLDASIKPSSPMGLASASCVNCGQCVAVCPVGALYEKNSINDVKHAIADPRKFVVAQVAPAVRVSIGESYGFPAGIDFEGRLSAAIRELGFDKVFDTKFSADLCIEEEANEFIDRIQNDGVLPLITSCCPGWIKYAEHFYPDMLDNISSCKSPQQMMGAVIKSYCAKKFNLSEKDIVVVSIMPCTAKKFEITRDYEAGTGVNDVDFVLTTNELGIMLKEADIQLAAFANEPFDEPVGEGTGAGVIFGVTGGVMEAALRTAVEKITGNAADNIEFSDVRGLTGVKEASYDVNGRNIKVAVVSGLANANMLLSRIKNGEADYQFIEIMACPGGCINGGGQPHHTAGELVNCNVLEKRAHALYKNDLNSTVRKSHENPAVIKLYDEYLGYPGSEEALKLLHTKYIVR